MPSEDEKGGARATAVPVCTYLPSIGTLLRRPSPISQMPSAVPIKSGQAGQCEPLCRAKSLAIRRSPKKGGQAAGSSPTPLAPLGSCSGNQRCQAQGQTMGGDDDDVVRRCGEQPALESPLPAFPCNPHVTRTSAELPGSHIPFQAFATPDLYPSVLPLFSYSHPPPHWRPAWPTQHRSHHFPFVVNATMSLTIDLKTPVTGTYQQPTGL